MSLQCYLDKSVKKNIKIVSNARFSGQKREKTHMFSLNKYNNRM